MAAREKGGDHVVDQRFLAEQDGVQRGAQRFQSRAGFGQFAFGGVLVHVGETKGTGEIGPVLKSLI